MNHIAPITINLIPINKSDSEERLQIVFNRIFTQAKKNLFLTNKYKKGIDDEYKQK